MDVTRCGVAYRFGGRPAGCLGGASRGPLSRSVPRPASRRRARAVAWLSDRPSARWAGGGRCPAARTRGRQRLAVGPAGRPATSRPAERPSARPGQEAGPIAPPLLGPARSGQGQRPARGSPPKGGLACGLGARRAPRTKARSGSHPDGQSRQGDSNQGSRRAGRASPALPADCDGGIISGPPPGPEAGRPARPAGRAVRLLRLILTCINFPLTSGQGGPEIRRSSMVGGRTIGPPSIRNPVRRVIACSAERGQPAQLPPLRRVPGCGRAEGLEGRPIGRVKPPDADVRTRLRPPLRQTIRAGRPDTWPRRLGVGGRAGTSSASDPARSVPSPPDRLPAAVRGLTLPGHRPSATQRRARLPAPWPALRPTPLRTSLVSIARACFARALKTLCDGSSPRRFSPRAGRSLRPSDPSRPR